MVFFFSILLLTNPSDVFVWKCVSSWVVNRRLNPGVWDNNSEWKVWTGMFYRSLNLPTFNTVRARSKVVADASELNHSLANSWPPAIGTFDAKGMIHLTSDTCLKCSLFGSSVVVPLPGYNPQHLIYIYVGGKTGFCGCVVKMAFEWHCASSCTILNTSLYSNFSPLPVCYLYFPCPL